MDEGEVWDLVDAKDHLGELIESATTKGPQTIRNPSGPDVVVESSEQLRDRQWPRFVDFFRNSPLVGLRIPHTDRPERDPPFANDEWDENE